MRTFRKDLKEKLKSKSFKKVYKEERTSFEEEKQLIDYGLLLKKYREEKNLSQQELATKAQVSQQQLSNIEGGANATMQTYIKICDALKIVINFHSPRKKEPLRYT